jgi:hypothetical protein
MCSRSAPRARALDRLLAEGRVQRVITEPPARLKPLDRDTVRLLPRKVEDAPGVAFSIDTSGMLRADVAPGAVEPARHRALEPGEHDLPLHHRQRGPRRALGAGRRQPPHRAGENGEVKRLAPGKAAAAGLAHAAAGGACPAPGRSRP